MNGLMTWQSIRRHLPIVLGGLILLGAPGCRTDSWRFADSEPFDGPPLCTTHSRGRLCYNDHGYNDHGRGRHNAPIIRAQYSADAGRVVPSIEGHETQAQLVSYPWQRGGRSGPVSPRQDVLNELSAIGNDPHWAEPTRFIPLDVPASETQTGRMMFGVGINSDAGLVGSIVLDEQNFDWTRFPRSFEEIRNATAWRGAGQRFRIEAVPGTEVQRYMVNFTEPYFLNTQVSLGLSGHYFTRFYQEWDEDRVGGRIALGYHLTHALTGGFSFRGEKVGISDPMEPAPPELTEVLGKSALYGFKVRRAHDTRDSAFLATEGHLIEASYEQVIGSYVYGRGELDVRKYFLLHQRPDGSGRHVLSLNTRVAVTGSDTPIYEHYYAGGFSTIRGFDFRGASTRDDTTGMIVGGHFMLLASAEYLFPITADDMLRGVIFCDTGTVEPSIDDWTDKYRVSPGFGLRIVIPAMGPAPIALDFAFPAVNQGGDRIENFSFFVGFVR